MTVSKYQKKPVVIEAIQFTGNDAECMAFCPTAIDPKEDQPSLIIPTLEGDHRCSLGDYIIKGIKGEFYPCKPDIFEATYNPVVQREPEPLVPRMDCTEECENLAGIFYDEYCKAVGGKAFNGDPLPAWSEFGSDPNKQKQANAWRTVAVMGIAYANREPIPVPDQEM